MDDASLVGVTDCVANLDEQFQTFANTEAVLVAMFGDGQAMNQLHHEVRSARLGRPGVEHLGNVRVIQQGQRLPLSLEAGDHCLGVHPQLNDLQGHTAVDGL